MIGYSGLYWSVPKKELVLICKATNEKFHNNSKINETEGNKMKKNVKKVILSKVNKNYYMKN